MVEPRRDRRTRSGPSSAAAVTAKLAFEAFKAVKDKVVDGAEAAGEKIADATKANPDKPTTGSGLLDLFAPAVPKDVVPKKDDKKDAPKPPTP